MIVRVYMYSIIVCISTLILLVYWTYRMPRSTRKVMLQIGAKHAQAACARATMLSPTSLHTSCLFHGRSDRMHQMHATIL